MLVLKLKAFISFIQKCIAVRFILKWIKRQVGERGHFSFQRKMLQIVIARGNIFNFSLN